MEARSMTMIFNTETLCRR